MISKSTIKLIKSLANKKFRVKENLFLVEGDKNVLEVLHSGYTVKQLFATSEFLTNNTISSQLAHQVFEVEKAEIKKASLLNNPQNAFALCEIPDLKPLPEKLDSSLSIYLDRIQDPGNLGTIIRICDWFGIENLFCSPETVDFYNPKTIQATMGSFCRVNFYQSIFEPVYELANKWNATVYGTFLNGENIYSKTLSEKAILVIGNEGSGISKEIENKINNKIMIPEFSRNNNGAESLNAAVATGIICSEFKRRTLKS